MGASPINAIPGDVQGTIASFLDVWSLRSLSFTCKTWSSLLSDKLHRADIALQSFGDRPGASLSSLTEDGLIAPSAVGAATFLFSAKGRLPPSAIGRALFNTAGDRDRESQQARAVAVVTRFLDNFDFSRESPVEALRSVLRHTRLPASHSQCTVLVKRTAARYADCAAGKARPRVRGPGSPIVPPTHATTWTTGHGLATYELSHRPGFMSSTSSSLFAGLGLGGGVGGGARGGAGSATTGTAPGVATTTTTADTNVSIMLSGPAAAGAASLPLPVEVRPDKSASFSSSFSSSSSSSSSSSLLLLPSNSTTELSPVHALQAPPPPGSFAAAQLERRRRRASSASSASGSSPSPSSPPRNEMAPSSFPSSSPPPPPASLDGTSLTRTNSMFAPRAAGAGAVPVANTAALSSSSAPSSPRSHNTAFAGGAAGSSLSALSPPLSFSSSLSSTSHSHIIHGFDVSTLDSDTLFVLLWGCVILNQDMRSAAVKQKMTADEFANRNRSIPSLSSVPSCFWHGCYQELLNEGLPLNDTVSTAKISSLSASAAAAAAAILPALDAAVNAAVNATTDFLPTLSNAAAAAVEGARQGIAASASSAAAALPSSQILTSALQWAKRAVAVPAATAMREQVEPPPPPPPPAAAGAGRREEVRDSTTSSGGEKSTAADEEEEGEGSDDE